MNYKNKIDQLPLFPLKLILLPFEQLPIHIFEPRYKKMISNAITYNKPFGIVLQDSDNIYKVGCQAIVSKVINSYKDGEYDIIVQGTNRFKINNTYMDSDTVIGKVDMLIDKEINDGKLIEEVHENYLKILVRMGNTYNLDNDLNKKISYEFVQNILLPINLKKQLISNNSEEERINIINKLFTKILSLPIDDPNNIIAKA